MGVCEQQQQEQGTRLLELLELHSEVFHLICSFLGKKTLLLKLAYHFDCGLQYKSNRRCWFVGRNIAI